MEENLTRIKNISQNKNNFLIYIGTTSLCKKIFLISKKIVLILRAFFSIEANFLTKRDRKLFLACLIFWVSEKISYIFLI